MCTIWTRRNARVNLRGAALGGATLLLHVPTKRREPACHPERRRREGSAFRERRTPAGPSRPFPLMRDATTSRSFARARTARFRPHPLSPSPHTRRGGTTDGLSFPSPEGRGDQRGEDHIMERGTGGVRTNDRRA